MKFINIFIRLSIFYTTITFGQKIIYTKKYSSGNPKIISYYLTEGIDEVIEHQYFGSGSIKKEGIYQFEKKQGNWKTYYSNGNLRKKESFDNGKLDGRMIEWYQNGNKKIEGQFRKGKKEGVFLFWDEDGSLHLKKSFVNGLKCSLIEYDKGSIVKSENYCG